MIVCRENDVRNLVHNYEKHVFAGPPMVGTNHDEILVVSEALAEREAYGSIPGILVEFCRGSEFDPDRVWVAAWFAGRIPNLEGLIGLPPGEGCANCVSVPGSTDSNDEVHNEGHQSDSNLCNQMYTLSDRRESGEHLPRRSNCPGLRHWLLPQILEW